jgi:hypothetical protein
MLWIDRQDQEEDTMENSDNEASDAFAEAQQAAKLREAISAYAAGAVKYANVDRDWANSQLVRLGADPISAAAEYQINIPITGNYGTTVVATSRIEAMKKFEGYVQNILDKGEVRSTSHGQGVFNVALNSDAGPASFFAGPQDPPPASDKVPGLDALKDGIRAMLKQGIVEQGWGYHHATSALDIMGLDPLPELTNKTVSVPLSGTAQLVVPVFEGDGDEAVQSAAAAKLGRMGEVIVKPEEIGWIVVSRSSESMGLKLVDEDGEEDPF